MEKKVPLTTMAVVTGGFSLLGYASVLPYDGHAGDWPIYAVIALVPFIGLAAGYGAYVSPYGGKAARLVAIIMCAVAATLTAVNTQGFIGRMLPLDAFTEWVGAFVITVGPATTYALLIYSAITIRKRATT